VGVKLGKLVIWGFGYLGIWLFGDLVIWGFGDLVIWGFEGFAFGYATKSEAFKSTNNQITESTNQQPAVIASTTNFFRKFLSV